MGDLSDVALPQKNGSPKANGCSLNSRQLLISAGALFVPDRFGVVSYDIESHTCRGKSGKDRSGGGLGCRCHDLHEQRVGRQDIFPLFGGISVFSLA